jgi:hypothetical protein
LEIAHYQLISGKYGNVVVMAYLVDTYELSSHRGQSTVLLGIQNIGGDISLEKNKEIGCLKPNYLRTIPSISKYNGIAHLKTPGLRFTKLYYHSFLY